MSDIITIVDTSANDALRRYATAQGLRGKDIIETVRKVMKYLVSFAIKKIPRGDPQKIRADLTQVLTTYSRISTRNIRSQSAVANKWRGTLAARIVFMLDWQGARVAAAFGDYDGAYQKASLFTNRRVFAAGLHRSGLREAITRLRASSGGGRLPKFKNQPGSYDEQISDNITTILVENWARAANANAKGITGLAPDAFSAAMPEVERMLTDFIARDMLAAAAREGLTATP